MSTVFLGDSLSAGLPGVSYFRFLRQDGSLINKGKGGDTLLGASARLDRLLHNARYDGVSHYIIEIGTNDVLLTDLNEEGNRQHKFVRMTRYRLNSYPCKDIDEFAIQYWQLIEKLMVHKKKIGIIGLPAIEGIRPGADRLMIRYDEVIKEVAKEYHIGYLDLRKLQNEAGSGNTTVCFERTGFHFLKDAVSTSLLPLSDQVSKARGLTTTVDGVHFNKTFAQKLARAVEETLLG